MRGIRATAIFSIILFLGVSAPVLAADSPPYVGGAPTVVTTGVSDIGSTSVVVYGLVNPNGSKTNAWFEYGITPNPGITDGFQAAGNGRELYSASIRLKGLDPDRTFYYRVVAQNSSGLRYAEVKSFRTQKYGTTLASTAKAAEPAAGGVYITPAVNQNEPLSPRISNVRPKPGEILTYTLNYKNTYPQAITAVSIKVFMSEKVEYLAAEPTPVIVGNNLVTFRVNSLPAKSEGQTTVIVRVPEDAPEGQIINFVATLDYYDPAGKVQFLTAPLTIQVSGGTLTASAGTVGRLPWYVQLIIFVLFIVASVGSYLGYRYFKSRRALATAT